MKKLANVENSVCGNWVEKLFITLLEHSMEHVIRTVWRQQLTVKINMPIEHTAYYNENDKRKLYYGKLK